MSRRLKARRYAVRNTEHLSSIYPVRKLECQCNGGVPWATSHTAFVVESFIDELAHAAGRDPYDFRRSMLAGHPRRKALLEFVAEKAGWGTSLPEDRHRGLAMHKSFNSFVAQVAEVSVGGRRICTRSQSRLRCRLRQSD